MANEKKFITCDGNYAAAHIAYLFSENGQSMLTNGLPKGRKTFSER